MYKFTSSDWAVHVSYYFCGRKSEPQLVRNKVDPVQENTQKDSLKVGSVEVQALQGTRGEESVTESGKELVKQELLEKYLFEKMLEKDRIIMKTRHDQDQEITAIEKEITEKKHEKELLEK